MEIGMEIIWAEKVVVNATDTEVVIARVGIGKTLVVVPGIRVPSPSVDVVPTLSLAEADIGVSEVPIILVCTDAPPTSCTSSIPALVPMDTKVEMSVTPPLG